MRQKLSTAGKTMSSIAPHANMESPLEPHSAAALVVLGMHRSGTSALAGSLAKAGCALPATLMEAQAENPRGYFESVALCRLNDDLLAAAGSSWSDWRALDPDWLRSEAMGAFGARAADALDGEFGAAPLIVLKDPRVCRLAPFWEAVLRRAGRRALFVCTHRPPGEVAASLAKRDGMSATQARLLWLRHVLDAEAATRGRARIFASYEGLLSDWRAELKRIADAFDLEWTRAPEDAGAEIDAFLSSDLRHFQGARASTDDRDWPWLRDAVGILDRWSRRGEAAEDHARLDALSAALSEAAPALSDLERYLDETPGLESWSGNPLLHFLRRDRRDEVSGLDGERA